MKNAKLAWELLDHHDKRRLGVLVVMMLINGGLEMGGMGLIFPYIALIGDPEAIHRNAALQTFDRLLGIASFNHLIIVLSLSLLGMFIFKNLFGLFLQALLLRFAMLKQLDLGRTQMSTCVVRPYEYFLRHNSADIVRNLTNSIPNVCTGVLVPWLNLLIEIVMVVCVLTLIVYVQPLAALSAMGVVGPLAYLLFAACKHRILRFGTEQNLEYRQLVKNATETLHGIKEIKASGQGGFFVDRYLDSAFRYLRALRHYNFLVQIPRAFLEVIMIGAITLVVLIMLFFSHQQIQQVVPLLAVYAAGGVRILPSFNRIIMAVNGIRFYESSVEEVVHEYREGKRLSVQREGLMQPAGGWTFARSIDLRNIRFRYAAAATELFDGLSLQINRGESVAFIGRSGSGKSTLVDLILGLLEPAGGTVSVDGREIGSDLPAWQQLVGYIPQHIYLVDDTLKRNVALGTREEDVDLDRLNRVLTMADLTDFVGQLPHGVDTVVGERGVTLSGGQRQRIGIARALYREPSLLIMDEATSALDNISEKKVIEAISALGNSVTVIMVAHRLSTVRYCHQVYLLEKGQVVDSGPYEQIAERHPYFINPAAGDHETAAVGAAANSAP